MEVNASSSAGSREDDLHPSTTAPSSVQQGFDVDHISQDFFNAIGQFLEKPHLELEVRLTFQVPPRKFGGVSPGVNAADFQVIQRYVSELVKADPASQQAMSHPVVTEDVSTPDGRLSFRIAEDGSSTFTKAVKKSKLRYFDIPLNQPQHHYNIRIALSEEAEELEDAAKAAAPPPSLSEVRGYRRRKSRISVQHEGFLYELTTVGRGDDQSFEVEIELQQVASQKTVTKEVVAQLLRNAAALSSLPGLTGVQVVRSQRGDKRVRTDGGEERRERQVRRE